MNRKYNIRLDLQFRCNNSKMVFDEFDNNTSDFFIRVTRAGELIDISKAIVTLIVIKPDNSVDAQFVEINSNRVYCDLKPTMKNLVGKYEAIASITLDGETINTDINNPIIYEVTENKFLRQLNEKIVTEERFTILTDMINRLSSIETNENTRIGNENFRVEAEKLREQAIEKIKNDATKLITDTKKEINDYKDAKDISINLDLTKYKEATTQDINDYKNTKNTEIDNYKNAKDLAIDNDLKQYKTNTTEDITQFKNAKNNELSEYKNAKDLEIDNYVINKNLEIDNYKSAKDIEIDNYKKLKDTEINAKLEEVDTAETLRALAEQKRVIDHQSREQFLDSFESQLAQIENKNIEQDTRIKEVERVNKVQDVYVRGLFNENKDGRLSSEWEGNSLKLEGSKQGLVEVERIVGNTLVNLNSFKDKIVIDSTVSNSRTKYVEWTHSKNSGLFTIKLNCIGDITKVKLQVESASSVIGSGITSSNGVYLVNTNGQEIKKIMYYVSSPDFTSKWEIDIITILEGDYTNKPIPSEHIEGLQSSFESNLVTQEMVTQGLEDAENLGKYKVPVRVVGKNRWSPRVIDALCDLNNWEGTGPYKTNKVAYDLFWEDISKNNSITITTNVIDVSPNFYPILTFKSLKTDRGIAGGNILASGVYQNSTDDILSVPNKVWKPNELCSDFTFVCYVNNWNEEYMTKLRNVLEQNMMIEIGATSSTVSNPTPYEEYFERNANVYLNSPLLENDEIVMKDGELCHYHRYVKEVLDGTIIPFFVKDINSDITMYGINLTSKATSSIFNVINDKFIVGLADESGSELLRIGNAGNSIFIAITNSKLSTADKFGVQQWLQSNHVIVVYELAEPYYEPISSDKLLLECANDSTIHLDTVVPVENIVASYTGGVPSVYALQETNQTQDSLIDISLCATDEMYMMIEPLLSAVPQTLNNERMISKMVDMYVAMVIRGLKTIDEVPVRYRKEVQTILDKLEE